MDISHPNLLEMEKPYRNTLINSLPGLKCLQMVGTMSENGHSNLGLFNSIFHSGSDPALLGMIFRPKSTDHATLSNIERTGFYTFNNVLEGFIAQAHQTSARYPAGFSEFVECGFTETFLGGFEAPFVAESTIKIALTLQEVLPIKINGTTLVIGKITNVHLPDNLVAKDGYVDHFKAGTLTVAGLDSYFAPRPVARFKYAKANQSVQEL